MRERITTIILSTVFLQSSLLAANSLHSFSKRPEIKSAFEAVTKRIAHGEDLIWKKSSDYDSLTVRANFTLAKIHAWYDRLNACSFFTHKSVKCYILFRVFRN